MNVNECIYDVKKIQWSGLIKMDDTQLVYSAFHKQLSEMYVSCFPFKKIANQYYCYKLCLTPGLYDSTQI